MIQTKTYTVNMHCPSCEMLLEGLDELPGVEKIEAHYKDQKLVVTFDDAIVAEDYIMAAVRKEDYEIQKTDAAS